MPEIKIIDEKPTSLIEAAGLLDKIEKRDKTLSERAVRSREYIHRTVKKSAKDLTAIRKKLESSEIARLKPRHIVKILDTFPEDVDSLKALFTAENITLKQEDLSKILECLK